MKERAEKNLERAERQLRQFAASRVTVLAAIERREVELGE